ncbi:unnamed protein product, partial [marine sediment metagenome]
VEWSIISLAGATLDANPVFKYDGISVSASEDEINPVTEEAPSSATDVNLWDYIASGTAYVDPFINEAGHSKEVDLGASAKAGLQTAVTASQSWFAIGFQSPGDECPTLGDEVFRVSNFYSEDKTEPVADPKPTLYVVYTPPAVGLENKSANMGSKMVAAGLI